MMTILIVIVLSIFTLEQFDSQGLAEVVFVKRSDALAAMKRYNNVRLDGKPMKIEIIGANAGAPGPLSARVNVVGGPNGRGKRIVTVMYVKPDHTILYIWRGACLTLLLLQAWRESSCI